MTNKMYKNIKIQQLEKEKVLSVAPMMDWKYTK